jgi:hypothetical protein
MPSDDDLTGECEDCGATGTDWWQSRFGTYYELCDDCRHNHVLEE